MIRKIFVIAAATALAAAALLIPAAQASSAASQSSSIVVRGRITHHHKGVAGAKIVLYANPPPAFLKKHQHRGYSVPMKRIGTTTTNKRGYYAVTLSATGLRLARAYAFGKPSVVNLEIAAYVKHVGAARWFSRTVRLGTLAAMDVPAASPLAMAPEVANLDIPDSVPAPPASLRSALGAQKPGNPYYCDTHYYSKNLGVRNTIVGSTYSNMSNVTMGFTYTRGADSSLGLSVSVIPPPGFTGWDALGYDMSLGGQSNVSSTATIPYASHHGFNSTLYKTGFAYALYFQQCVGGYTQSVSFAGGRTVGTGYSPASDNHWCRYYNAASAPVQFNNQSAYQFTAGVNISAWINFNLSSETGYSSTAEADYTLPKGGYLCGTTNYAVQGGSTNQIYAGKYNHSPPKRKAA